MTPRSSSRTDVTARQAAEILGVSPPFMNRLLENGTVPCHGTGFQRRVLITDLMAYKTADDERRRQTADLLGALGQELGI